MSNQGTNPPGAIGALLPAALVGLVALGLVIAKLAGAIAWPWLWVLSPVWGGVALVLAGAVLAGMLAAASGGWR